jgi:hypothetical protein
MATRLDVVDWALFEANAWYGDTHWKPTSTEMIDIFTTAGLTAPSNGELEKFKKAASNIVIGGQSKSWCGIFACYVLKKYGGLDVSWSLTKGRMLGTGFDLTWSGKGMRPGDVAIVRETPDSKGAAVHHHFIVTKVDYTANTMESVDGNSTNNEIVWHTNKKIFHSKNKNLSVYAHYKLKME